MHIVQARENNPAVRLWCLDLYLAAAPQRIVLSEKPLWQSQLWLG